MQPTEILREEWPKIGLKKRQHCLTIYATGSKSTVPSTLAVRLLAIGWKK
ncbi:hypothetical protein CfE428DRAFT_1558 [Chthoniobacter flavus Ellin428]|uniref:Uncharacterized protein n=1 Tax=Chthoniobacter flavus Ellin428 TaxID=497964 RepID=B4CWU5_9BACT|nr:hypothetical protein CfE428DRAFT_1558 [Chthoniobacter flavus Ellin428]TCO87632.1 hypothetical protein EV701_121134 [Chthoniobacter flavus]